MGAISVFEQEVACALLPGRGPGRASPGSLATRAWCRAAPTFRSDFAQPPYLFLVDARVQVTPSMPPQVLRRPVLLLVPHAGGRRHAGAYFRSRGLWQAIAELPERQRQALLLREFSGLSYSELAAALAVSEPAVESLLFRARDALRIRLQPAFGTLAGLAPLLALRNLFAKVTGEGPDPAALSGLARIAGASAVAKVAVIGAAIVTAGGAVAVVEQGSDAPPRRPPDLAALSAHVDRRAPAVPSHVRPQPRRRSPQPQRERRRIVPVPSSPATHRLTCSWSSCRGPRC